MMNNQTGMSFYELEIITHGAFDITLGIIATLASIALYLQPLPTFFRICKKKDSGGLLPYPYVFIEFSSLYWLTYASPLTETTIQFRDYCMCCSTSIGCIVGIIYIFIFFQCCKHLIRFKFLAIGVCFICLSWFNKQWWDIVLQGKNGTLGPIVVIFGVMMYASPIFTLFDALRTKRVDYLPIGLLLASSFNGLAWTVYACLPSNFDLCIAIANGLGTIFSVTQLGLAYDIRSFITSHANQINYCNDSEDDVSKFMHNASTPLLINGSDDTVKVRKLLEAVAKEAKEGAETQAELKKLLEAVAKNGEEALKILESSSSTRVQDESQK